MINLGWNSASILGIVEAVLGIALLIFAPRPSALASRLIVAISTMLIASGGILLFNGWRLDPILQLAMLFHAVVIVLFVVKDLAGLK